MAVIYFKVLKWQLHTLARVIHNFCDNQCNPLLRDQLRDHTSHCATRLGEVMRLIASRFFRLNVIAFAALSSATFPIISPADAGTKTYTYDQHGRLTGVALQSGRKVTYEYDAAGNRTRRVVADINYTPAPLDWYDVHAFWNGVNGGAPTPNYADTQTLTVTGMTANVSATLTFATDEISSLDTSGASLHVIVYKNGVASGSVSYVQSASGETPLATIGSLAVTNGDTLRFRVIVSAQHVSVGSGMSDWRSARLVIRNSSAAGTPTVDAVYVSGTYTESDASCGRFCTAS